MKRDNIKKVSRLGYVIILFVCSYLFFIGNSYTYYSPAGESLHKGLTSIFTEYYFVSCRQVKVTEPTSTSPFFVLRNEKRCSGPEKSIEIDNLKIFPNTFYSNPQHNEALNKFNNNPDRKYTYEYSSNFNYASEKSKKITEVIMWVVFLLTIPLIWFTRDFSIQIVNFSISLVSKGWKKL